MSPLSIDVWIYILTAYLAVSLILYTISRLVFNGWLVNPVFYIGTIKITSIERFD
jgi:hypothetical protein